MKYYTRVKNKLTSKTHNNMDKYQQHNIKWKKIKKGSKRLYSLSYYCVKLKATKMKKNEDYIKMQIKYIKGK